MAENFNQAMSALVEIGQAMPTQIDSGKVFIEEIIQRKQLTIEEILTERNKGILLASVRELLKQNKPIPQPTKDLLHAIYLLQNPDLTPKDACELLEEVSEYGELITLLDFRAIDSSNTQIALLIDDTELHEPAVISRLQAHRFVRDLKNALGPIKGNQAEGPLGFIKKSVLMPFFTVLLHEITTTSNNFNPNEFNWGEIMSNIEIATKRGIQIFIEFQEKSTKKSLVENLDDLLSFFEQYCKEISIDHTPVSKVMRNHIREMKKNLLSK